ncbi:MAG: DMT family transporter [Planctomycetes bacterium]|nr:DMT family transporter [Planctomycetota bacterium]
MSGHTGEIAAIGASLTWAASSLVFSTSRAPPAALNLFKNAVATVLYLGTLAASAWIAGDRMLHAGREAFLWLAGSSLVGIVIGDTCYFRSLQALGARRALVVTTTAPPLSVVLAWLCLGETPGGAALAGIAVTLAGVVLVVGDAAPLARAGAGERGRTAEGVACGIAAALCQVLGAILSKKAMEHVPPLEAAFIRIALGGAAVFALALVFRRVGPWSRELLRPRAATRLAAASACGTYAGIWLYLVAIRHADVAVATTLTSLSPVFILPLARAFLGHPITPRALAGAALAVGGVALLFG